VTAIPSIPWQLGPDQLRELAEAREAGKYLRRAIAFANLDGWTLVAASALSFVCGLASISSMIVAIALGAIATVELRGANQLRRLDESAARKLAFNQIALGTLIALYAIWRIYDGLHGPSPYAEVTRADPRMGHRIEDMARSLTVAIYGCLILFAIFAQGGAALFYFTREKHIRAYRSRTPGWILQMQHSGVAV
jgi:hypothetical protein